MSAKAKLRCIGIAILLVNLWAIGRFDLGTISAGLLTLGFAVAFELWVVRDAGGADAKASDHVLKALMLAAACGVGAFLFAGTGKSGHVEPIVDRRPLLGCPGGYVDHPYDPSKCVLPGVIDRYNRRAR